MNYKDNIEWLKSLKQQIGQTQHRDLWHFEQVIDETIENLKPLAKPHGRLIDADRLLALVEKEVNNTCIGCEPEPDDCCAYDRFKEIISEIKTAQTIIEAEVSK